MSADAQPDALDVSFPTRRILAIVGDKWTTVVLYCLSIREHRRFNELQKQIPDISKKMLIQTLRNLERDGLLERTVSHDLALRRMQGAGVIMTSWIQVLLEFQRDWTRKETYDGARAIVEANGGGYGIGLAYSRDMIHPT